MQHLSNKKTVVQKRKPFRYGPNEITKDLQLAEYERLYIGIHNQMDGIRMIVTNSMLLAGVAIPVLIVLVQQQVHVALLLTPIIFTSAAWMFEFHTHSIFVTGYYITNRLTAEVKKNFVLNGLDNRVSVWEFDPIFSGEETRGWKRLVIRFLGSLNVFLALSIILLPGVVSIASWYIIRANNIWSWWESTLFILNLSLIVVVFIFAALNPYLVSIYFNKRSSSES